VGAEFREGSLSVFPWLAVAELFFAIQAFYFAMAFQIKKNTVQLMWIMLFATIVNIIFNIILIPIYGILGAAIATIISSVSGAIISYYYGRKLYILPIPWVEILKISIATLIMIYGINGLMTEQGWGWLIIQILVGAVIYLSLILLLNVANIRNDVKEFLAPIVAKKFNKNQE
jgi:O-antigen/teichoic acid export membrane protein